MPSIPARRTAKPAELREVPVPEPGPGEVLVQVGGAGACHSDLHMMEAPPDWRPRRLPFTIGHENAGWVEKLGPGTTEFVLPQHRAAQADAFGQRRSRRPVIVYGPWGCGTCANCRVGMENYCENTGGLDGGGLGGNDGGWLRTARPATRFLIPLGILDPREADPLSDAGAHELSRRQAVAPSAVAGLDRGRDRDGRPRPDGHLSYLRRSWRDTPIQTISGSTRIRL